MDGAAAANVREVGDGDDVEDAPDEVGGLAFEGEAQLPADPGVRAVAADEVFGFEGLEFAGCARAGADEVVGVVWCEGGTEEAIGDGCEVLLGGSF